MDRVWEYEHCEELARKAECYETPEWAADAILRVELLPEFVIDPGCGRGVLAEAARRTGHTTIAFDLHEWGYRLSGEKRDFLQYRNERKDPGSAARDTAVMMNPPFSRAEEWVAHAFLHLNVRKVLCFQRFAWWESKTRDTFWADLPPQRVYICAERATCWRIDIPPWKRNVPKKDGGAGSSTPIAHAWFVWERGQPPGPLMGRLHKDGGVDPVVPGLIG